MPQDDLNLKVGADTITFVLEDEELTVDVIADLINFKGLLNRAPTYMGRVFYRDAYYTVDDFEAILHSEVPEIAERTLGSLRSDIDELKAEMGQVFKRLQALESRAPEKSKAKGERAYLRALTDWHRRIKAGNGKLIKINTILQLAGIKVEELSNSGHVRFKGMQIGGTRSVKTIEDIYDEMGEDALRKVANAMGSIEGAVYRKEHWDATVWCLLERTPPMGESEFKFGAAIFFPKSREELRPTSVYYSNAPIHVVLSRLIANEFDLQ